MFPQRWVFAELILNESTDLHTHDAFMFPQRWAFAVQGCQVGTSPSSSSAANSTQHVSAQHDSTRHDSTPSTPSRQGSTPGATATDPEPHLQPPSRHTPKHDGSGMLRLVQGVLQSVRLGTMRTAQVRHWAMLLWSLTKVRSQICCTICGTVPDAVCHTSCCLGILLSVGQCSAVVAC